ncbi:N-6 DNA methylase [Nocardiopsis quinghaiensis]|uniref:N-6 DNA methylase n=1 Tax=Nocardiopsis quinghaiensis TaxID=464995 RepID=UPI0012389F6F|nr:N-6 DNA methylase [Nocardiopsis quinghaiensis]
MATNKTPDAHAHAIADAVDTAWHRAHGYGHLEVPLSVVAAFAFLAPPPHEREAVTVWAAGLGRDEMRRFVRTQWTAFLNARPDLANPIAPFALVWHGDRQLSDQALRGAHDVARSAVRTGLFDLTGDADIRRSVDLFGVLLTVMKGRNVQSAQGAFYTPGHIADLLSSQSLPSGTDSVFEPTVGTGGMFRAAARTMRERGEDPACATWVGIDVDPLAIACAAVNAVLWELGSGVVLGVGDSLSEDAVIRALAQRDETVRTAHHVRIMRRTLDALETLTTPRPNTRPHSRKERR